VDPSKQGYVKEALKLLVVKFLFYLIFHFRLFETEYSLLDDLDLLITLQNLKTTAAAITEQLSVAEITEVELDRAREVRYLLLWE